MERTRRRAWVLCDGDPGRQNVGVLAPGARHLTRYLASEDPAWQSEIEVTRALEALGYEVGWVLVRDRVDDLFAVLRHDPKAVFFNMCESLGGDRAQEAIIPAVLQGCKAAYTGERLDTLLYCHDKWLTRLMVAAAGVTVPAGCVVSQGASLRSCGGWNMPWPVIVKPRDGEASEGVEALSIAADLQSAERRIRYLHRSLRTDALVEEFVLGREMYVSVLRDIRGSVVALPPIELKISDLRDDEYFCATQRVKWDEGYRRARGISLAPLGAEDRLLQMRLERSATAAAQCLGVSSHVRVDFRVRPSGEVCLLEVNANPSLLKDDAVVLAAEAADIRFSELIALLVERARGRHRIGVQGDGSSDLTGTGRR